MPERDTGLAVALERAGGVVQLAKRLKLHHGTVSRWRRVPEGQLAAVRRATGLSFQQLRPDVAARWTDPAPMTCQPVAVADVIASELGARAAAYAEQLVAKHMGLPVERIGRTNCQARSLAIYLACTEVEGPDGLAPAKAAVARHFQVFHQSVSRTVARLGARRDGDDDRPADTAFDALCDELGSQLRRMVGAGQ